MADIFAKLMSKLGFERFAVQGGDWGASIGSRLGYAYPERLIGIHLNFLAAVRRDPSRWINGTAEERAYAATLGRFIHSGTGYAVIQGTKPMSLAAALVDSPSGLLAWIAEKFYAWSDAPGIDDDKVLSCVSWYWFTGCAGASMWPYYVRHNRGWPIPEGKTIDAPVGYAEFPKEINRPPKTVAAEMYTNIRRWTTMESGGHFAALERPKELAAEIRAFFAELRSQAHGHPI